MTTCKEQRLSSCFDHSKCAEILNALNSDTHNRWWESTVYFSWTNMSTHNKEDEQQYTMTQCTWLRQTDVGDEAACWHSSHPQSASISRMTVTLFISTNSQKTSLQTDWRSMSHYYRLYSHYTAREFHDRAKKKFPSYWRGKKCK